MKLNSRVMTWLSLTGLVLLLAACGSTGGGPSTSTVTTVSITNAPSPAQLQIGSSVDLNATVTGSAGVSQAVTWQTSNAAVATVTTEGLVQAVSAGTVDITATSTVDTSKSDTLSLTILVTALDCSNAEELPSSITENLTLTAGKCYRVVTGEVSVRAVLTIQPGVTIEVEADKRIDIESDGHLIAVGTASQPIVIKGTTTTSGFWDTLRILSGNVTNTLEYVKFSDGGGNNSFPSNVWVSSSGKVSIKNSSFSNSARYGLYVSGGAQIQDFVSNSFSNNNIPIYLRAEHMASLDNASTYNDANTENYIDVDGGTTTASGQWPATNAPFRVLDGTEVSLRHDITVEAGARVEFEGGSRIDVETDGSLNAQGTAASKVVFTGTSAVKGAWDTIRFMSDDVNNVLDNVEVSFGGDNTSFPGNVWVSSSGKLTVTNSLISNSDQFGIFVSTGGQLTQSGNTFTDNTSGDIGPS